MEELSKYQDNIERIIEQTQDDIAAKLNAITADLDRSKLNLSLESQMRDQSEYFKAQVAELREDLERQVQKQQTQSSTVSHMEINFIERKLTGMIEDMQRQIGEMPSHKHINTVESDTNKRIKEMSLVIEKLQHDNGALQ